MRNATLQSPNLTTFCRLDDLGLEVTGQLVTHERTVLVCRVVEADDWCHRCGSQGRLRDSVTRRLAHEPSGWRPTVLLLQVRRYRCEHCKHVWRQDTTAAAAPRAKLSRAALRWSLVSLVCQHLSVARVAEALDVSWDAANRAVLAEGHRLLIDDERRFEHVTTIGVDEHVWRHTRHGDKYVTVIIDLTPIRAKTGPSRLLDMVEGRSKAVFRDWLEARPDAWRTGVEIVAMDGFTGFKSAAVEQLPDAVEVLDPFHVVKLAGDALDTCRQRVQQATTGHRGRTSDPLSGVRRALHTGTTLLTERQIGRLESVFANPEHAEVEAVWTIYQRVITAYREPRKQLGKTALRAVINALAEATAKTVPELATLGTTFKRRAADILAFFDHPGSSNGPTEAINGRLEHLRGIALGFRNLTHYIARSLLETGGFRPYLHSQTR
ncbi:ISL3 family transposase [Pseudoclavibacter helvolus]|uniref:ISL3 family transposase n=1 Tax=Pseudoclavibacter helvolus TaxID=255205 RepID=UPI0024ACBC21|nr:ISL3 family transposase [Pseudoclavibacter helvolus]